MQDLVQDIANSSERIGDITYTTKTDGINQSLTESKMYVQLALCIQPLAVAIFFGNASSNLASIASPEQKKAGIIRLKMNQMRFHNKETFKM